MNNCCYIFKKGKFKGDKCNKLNCLIHNNIQEKLIVSKITLINSEPIKTKILNLSTSNENKNIILKHYNNIKRLEPNSSEFYKNQLFIENSLSIPWNKYYNIFDEIKKTPISIFINYIKSEFDKEIFGMDNIKNEIINYVCKFISNPLSITNNIALHGNAGVCKTKFVKILSKILNIPFKIIPLGGVKDSSHLLGHNYTYVEATYGIISQGIIQSKIMNPILYFDELDKVSDNNGQDIYSVLSNITDPTINNQFNDRYFGNLTIDISKIFYIFTFNDISKINKVLLDRLNVIYIQNPSNFEKIIILEKFCLKDILHNIGIKNITFEKECFKFIIDYTDKTIDLTVSSGIRESLRILEKILLEINKQIFLGNITSTHITFLIFKSYFYKLEPQFKQGINRIDNFSQMYI